MFLFSFLLFIQSSINLVNSELVKRRGNLIAWKVRGGKREMGKQQVVKRHLTFECKWVQVVRRCSFTGSIGESEAEIAQLQKRIQ